MFGHAGDLKIGGGSLAVLFSGGRRQICRPAGPSTTKNSHAAKLSRDGWVSHGILEDSSAVTWCQPSLVSAMSIARHTPSVSRAAQETRASGGRQICRPPQLESRLGSEWFPQYADLTSLCDEQRRQSPKRLRLSRSSERPRLHGVSL
jgi:hypothetical protein